ncbi:MAG: hypothetical protein E7006_03030 [Alphaproteobacteria bacterium]|nr:hypothetical protein [Alphaproteobacteria bacterium]
MICPYREEEVGRMFRFLRIVALLPVLFFTSNLMAAGYTCLADGVNVEYTACDSGYYLTGTGVGNSCVSCATQQNTATLQTKSIANGTLYQKCTGNYTGGATSDTATGVSTCTGCSASTWTVLCDSGYVNKSIGQNFVCEKSSGFTCDEEKQYDSCSAGYYMAVLSGGVWVYNGTPTPGNACVTCPAGKYCTGGTVGPADCAAGTYSGVGAAQCAACAAGSYSGVGAAQCTLCAAGTYQPNTGQASCISCGAGMGANGSDVAGGYYTGNVYGEYATGATSCTPCPKPGVTTKEYLTPTIDSKAYVYQMDANGNSSVYSSDVTVATANVQGWGGLGTIAACRVTYTYKNVAGNVVHESVPYDIDSGTYDMTKQSGGIYVRGVNEGFYARNRYSDTYCDRTTNNQLYKTFYVCPAGSYCPGSAALGGLRSCSATGADAYLNNDTIWLVPCAAGSYQPNIGQSSCMLADPGSYVGTTGQTKQTACGNVSRTENGKTLSVPTYSENAGATSCTACPQAKSHVDEIESYGYGDYQRNSLRKCYVVYDGGSVDIDNGSIIRFACYWASNGTDSDYGISNKTSGNGCDGRVYNLSCDEGYYNTTNTSETWLRGSSYDNFVANACGKNGVNTGVYSPDGDPYGYTCPSVPDEFSQYSQYYVGVRGGEECTYEYDNVPFTNGSGKISDVTCMWDDISAITDPEMSPGELMCSANISGLAPSNLKCSAGYYYANTDEYNDWDWDGVYLDDIASLDPYGSSGAPCQPVGKGYASAADVLTRTACSTVRATVVPDVYGMDITSVPTYSDTTTAASCTACPAAQEDWKDIVSNYGYWSSNGLNDDKTRCHVGLKPIELDHGDIEAGTYCYWSPKANGYGISETSLGSADAENGRGCYLPQRLLHCDDQYYSTAAATSQQFFVNLENLENNACVAVTTPGKYSPAGDIALIDCPTGTDTNISQKYAAKREWVNENFFGTNRCAHTYGNIGRIGNPTAETDYVAMRNLRCTLSADYTHYVCGADSVTCGGGKWNNDDYLVGYYDYDMGECEINGEYYDGSCDMTVGNCNDGGWGTQGRVCNGDDNCTEEYDWFDCADVWNEEKQMYVNPYTGGVFTACEYYCSTGSYGEYGAGCTRTNLYLSHRTCDATDTTQPGYTLLENGFYSDGCDWYEEDVICGEAWNGEFYENPYNGMELEECADACGDDGDACDSSQWIDGEYCGGEATNYIDCDYLLNGNGEYMVGDTKIAECYSTDSPWPSAYLSTNMVPYWYVYDVDAVQCNTETEPGYYSDIYSFNQEQCYGGSGSYAEYQDEYGAASCKYCHDLAGGLFPSGSASHAGNTGLMDTPYDCYGNGTGAYSSSCSSCYGGCTAGYYLTYADASDPETAYCADVGAGHWSAGGQTVYYGDSGSYNSCPAGETTVGYGIGADEAGDCGKKMHVGNSEMYLRSTKVTTPSLNVLRNGKTYYANMSPMCPFTVSKDAEQSFRAEYNDQEYWIYDQSAGELQITVPKSYGQHGYNDSTGTWWAVVDGVRLEGIAALDSTTAVSSRSNAGKIAADGFVPDGKKNSSGYAGVWCKITSPFESSNWVFSVEGNRATGRAAYYCGENWWSTGADYERTQRALYSVSCISEK